MRVWDIEQSKIVKTLEDKTTSGMGMFTALAWGLDGRLCTGDSENSVCVWDMETYVCTHKFAHSLNDQERTISAVARSRDGKLCSAASHELVVWDVSSSSKSSSGDNVAEVGKVTRVQMLEQELAEVAENIA